MGKKNYNVLNQKTIVSLILFAALASIFQVSANKNSDQMYNSSRFFEFYRSELIELNGVDLNQAATAIYTISRNQSPDIAVFLEKLWLKQKIFGVKVRHELFEDKDLKLILARALIERNRRLEEVLMFVFSTVDFNDMNEQYRTIEALRESNDNRSLQYLRQYSVEGNRSIKESMTPNNQRAINTIHV